MRRLVIWLLAAAALLAHPVAAQQSDELVWVQVEAQPSLGEALARAESFAQRFDDVNGFALGGGWYAIALGPYRPGQAEEVLSVYRAEGAIPRDSYIARTANYGSRFFPPAQDLLRRVAPEPVAPVVVAPAAPTEPAPMAPAPVAPAASATLQSLEAAVRQDLETSEQARLAERNLSEDDRRSLQEALQWSGFYDSAIDGAFGPGTRRAMAAWQGFNGLPESGILTAAQRALLLGQYNEVLADLGMARYRDETIGLALQLPLGVLAFERYEPPFAHFGPAGSVDARALLISQPGNRATLASLYDVMQTLEVVPLDGPRSLEGDAFTLVGRTERFVSETRVRLQDGALKGFTLVWPNGDELRRERLVEEMARSLVRLEGVMDPALGDGAHQQIDFIAGLAVRKPKVARSGFFVDSRGAVVTTTEAVENCQRILINDTYEARVSRSDMASGLAVLVPVAPLAPPRVAQLRQGVPRLQSGVAVAGYSFEGVLGAPSVTFGTLTDLKGLRGETELNRLQLASLPGDAGGPVLDDSGHVVGMLLPRGEGDRQLPDDVSFSLTAEAIARVVRDAGLATSTAESAAALPPEDITLQGVGVTVLVTCWE